MIVADPKGKLFFNENNEILCLTCSGGREKIKGLAKLLSNPFEQASSRQAVRASRAIMPDRVSFSSLARLSRRIRMRRGRVILIRSAN